MMAYTPPEMIRKPNLERITVGAVGLLSLPELAQKSNTDLLTACLNPAGRCAPVLEDADLTPEAEAAIAKLEEVMKTRGDSQLEGTLEETLVSDPVGDTPATGDLEETRVSDPVGDTPAIGDLEESQVSDPVQDTLPIGDLEEPGGDPGFRSCG